MEWNRSICTAFARDYASKGPQKSGFAGKNKPISYRKSIDSRTFWFIYDYRSG